MKEFLKKLFARKPKVVKTDVNRRFELIARVGQGSMSRFFRARDTFSGKIVGLKILDKEKTLRFESRFSPELKKPTEGEIAVSLKHPYIVNTYEWGTTLEGEQFIVMEFIDGVSLSYLIDVQNALMRAKRLSLMIQLGEAIHYLYENKWIHRDICPRNVLISDETHSVKLIDFGLMVPNTPPFRAPGNRTGTASYMAPELIKRQKTDHRIDVYSYAITCYEMFARRFPWPQAESIEAVLQHINTPPVELRELVPDVDEQVAKAIMKGLASDPSARWPEVLPMLHQFREVLNRQKESEKLAKPPAAQPSQARPSVERSAKRDTPAPPAAGDAQQAPVAP
jgi:serine/threonine protein kinase